MKKVPNSILKQVATRLSGCHIYNSEIIDSSPGGYYDFDVYYTKRNNDRSSRRFSVESGKLV